MKKVFSLMLLFATLFAVAACGDEDKDEPKDTLKDTAWTRSYGEDLLVLYFVDDSHVEFYGADKYMNIQGKTYRGTYKRSGNQIEFDLYGAHYIEIKFHKGKIVGNSMEIECTVDRVVMGEPLWESETLTFRKK